MSKNERTASERLVSADGRNAFFGFFPFGERCNPLPKIAFLRFPAFFLAFFLVSFSTFGNDPASVEIVSPWVRLMPPVAENSAAYFTVVNPTGKSLEIVSCSSPASKFVELHRVKKESGLKTMERIPSVAVPPQSSFQFEPGGYHLMMIGLKSALTKNQTVAFTCQTNAEPLEFEAVVRS